MKKTSKNIYRKKVAKMQAVLDKPYAAINETREQIFERMQKRHRDITTITRKCGITEGEIEKDVRDAIIEVRIPMDSFRSWG
jgi:hypothetical protein